MSECVEVNCVCCDRVLKAERTYDPVAIIPVYHGLVFRATGNFGSTVFDPMPIKDDVTLQIIVCDDCIRKNAKRVTLIRHTAKIEEFDPDES